MCKDEASSMATHTMFQLLPVADSMNGLILTYLKHQSTYMYTCVVQRGVLISEGVTHMYVQYKCIYE